VSERLEIVKARQSGMTLREVSNLYGASTHAITYWTKSYETYGLPGLERKSGMSIRERQQSAKVEAAEGLIAAATAENPDAGISKIQGEVYRRGFLDLARETVRKIMRRQGTPPQERTRKRRNRPPVVKTFERANPNDLWQTDIMTFMLKGQYRVYVIGFMDDNSRFIVGWGLYRFQTGANVQEVFRAAIEKHGMPKEVLSDNGRQYHSWRGKSAFTQTLTKLGIRHVRARPYHPQTCGKIESFWRNLYQEMLSQIPVSTFEEAQSKIGEYIEYYNFKRPHQGIGNLIPSDRYYKVDGQVKQIVEENTTKVEESAAPVGDYKAPTYIVGNIGGRELRLVAKDAEVTFGEKGDVAKPEQAAEPAGAHGADPVGIGAEGTGEGAVPASACVEGVVLPVDGAGAAGGVEGTGAAPVGAEGGASSGSGSGDIEAASEAGGAGEGEAAASQGERAPGVDTEDGEADDPSSGLGGAGGAV